MTRLLNLALDILFGKQEQIERRTPPPVHPSTIRPPSTRIGINEHDGGAKR